MYIIVVQNHNRVVSGCKAGLIEYAYAPAGRSPKLFASEQEATEWWSKHAPTLPEVGSGGIRVESVPPRVTDHELTKITTHMRDDPGHQFDRIQDGYADGVPRAVFFGPDDEPIGVPVKDVSPVLLLVGRLAADLRDARAVIERLEHACPDCGEDARGADHEGMA